jgi:uncharacterized RDD family membrane protein YckC
MALQNDPGSAQSLGARCAEHVSSPAIATCSRCGTYICAQCYCVGENGNYYCFNCDARMPVLADRGERFAANLVDNLVIYAPMFMGFLIGVLLSNEGDLSSVFPALGVLISLGVACYQLYLTQYGQSIGKRQYRIRVVLMDGSPASVARILLLRNFVPGLLASFCGPLGLIDSLMIFGNDKRCLHDAIAGTKVVKVPRGTNGV